MLRLALPTESFWVDCPYGVRLLCRPLTTPLNHAAIARAARTMREFTKDNPADPRVTDPDMRAGWLAAESVAALGEVLIEAWEGVGDAGGAAAAPVTPANIRLLLALPEIERAFNTGISQPIALLSAEGNA